MTKQALHSNNDTISSKRPNKYAIKRARHARLAAVQALYQYQITEIDAQELISEFLTHRLDHQQDSTFSLSADSQLFTDIVHGFFQHHTKIDRLICSVLGPKISFKRLEVLIQSILRAAGLELLVHKHLAPPIVLNEYITIAKAFFNGREPAIINGILDAIVHQNQTSHTDIHQNSPLVDQLTFDDKGLIPVIVQQHDTNEVLMVAWMNTLSISETLRTGFACYWSRRRDCLWRKGETSGHWQTLVEIRIDCDSDTLLLRVDQQGVACHTGHRSCFYRAWRNHTLEEIDLMIKTP